MGALPSDGGDETLKPFWAYNRIESRPRRKQFERVLKAEIHDPLWMLGRQWQMGEFKGNDTGSGIFARMQVDYSVLSGMGEYGSTAINQYDPLQSPIEPLVEPVYHDWSLKERVLMGKKWLGILKKKFSTVSYQAYQAAFADPANEYTINLDEPVIGNDPHSIVLKKAEVFSDKNAYSFQVGITNTSAVVDGGKLFKDFYGVNLTTALATITGNNINVPTNEENDMHACITEYAGWVQRMYSLPTAGSAEYWNPRKMEYEFKAYTPKDSGNLWPLPVTDYHQGHLDWYSFVEGQALSGTSVNQQVKEIQVIMSEARFPGMPSSRWWEFEDGSVNFCNIDANTTDLAKIIVTQFALVYQDDWFMVPVKMKVGSYSEMKGLVVTDVFGVKTFVPHNSVSNYTPVVAGGFIPDNNWKHWRWLDIGKEENVIRQNMPAGKMILPPVTSKVMESKPFESVVFIRDEMSNMVWGIEKIVPDNLGRGADGDNKAHDLVEYLKRINPDNSPVSQPLSTAKIKYELNTTTIPENWIPFLPVHTGNSHRAIQLQRASMPRLMAPYSPSLVRPRTKILRYDINEDNIPTAAYFVNEEEVPRSGAIVETSYQRCRWYNGKTISWVGRRKTTGRGEGASGLLFDQVRDAT